jgi:hypothetical protein
MVDFEMISNFKQSPRSWYLSCLKQKINIKIYKKTVYNYILFLFVLTVKKKKYSPIRALYAIGSSGDFRKRANPYPFIYCDKNLSSA